MYVALLSGEQPEHVGSTTSSTSRAADVNTQQKLSPAEEAS